MKRRHERQEASSGGRAIPIITFVAFIYFNISLTSVLQFSSLLHFQFFSLFFGNQILFNSVEFFGPRIRKWRRRRREAGAGGGRGGKGQKHRRKVAPEGGVKEEEEKAGEEEEDKEGEEERTKSRWESDFALQETGDLCLFNEYLDMVR